VFKFIKIANRCLASWMLLLEDRRKENRLFIGELAKTPQTWQGVTNVHFHRKSDFFEKVLN
jgi:hypothetical protein